jgi:AAA domain
MKIAQVKSNTAPIILIYGSEGRGKTTLACKAPNPIALLLERGIPKGVTVDAVEDIKSFEDVLGVCRSLYADQQGYQTLVIDTVDALESLIIEHTCIRHGWKHIESPSYGRGWVLMDNEWRHLIRAISALRDRGMAIILTCHADVMKIDDPRAPSYSSYQPKLHKRGRGLIMDACDGILFLAEDLRTTTDGNDRVRASAGSARYLFTEGSPAFAAKNRWGLPAKVPLPLDFDFGELARYWA